MTESNAMEPDGLKEQLREQFAEDSRSVDELIRDALARMEKGEDLATEMQEAVILDTRGTREVLEAACELSHSAHSDARHLGAHILGQLGCCARTLFQEERYHTLTAMLTSERDESVIESIFYALGHLHDARAIEEAAAFRNHSNPDVRFAVTFAVSSYDEPTAISILIALSRDENPDVRNWATFGLAQQIDADSDAIREALMARLGDEDHGAWGEALIGLARRNDPRVVDALLATRDVGIHNANTLEAAYLALDEFGDERLCPLLCWLLEYDDPICWEHFWEAIARDYIRISEMDS